MKMLKILYYVGLASCVVSAAAALARDDVELTAAWSTAAIWATAFLVSQRTNDTLQKLLNGVLR